jgi:hypothetical protein
MARASRKARTLIAEILANVEAQLAHEALEDEEDLAPH